MKIIYLVFAHLFCFCQCIYAQIGAPVIQWQKSLGGTADEVAFSVKQTPDNGYIVAGFTNSNDGDVTGNHGGEDDIWIVKLDNAGNIQWKKTYGGTGDDKAFSVQITPDGGYIVGCTSNSIDGDIIGNHGDYDIWIAKLTSDGEIQWQKSLGGNGDDEIGSIQKTNDGGYIITGGNGASDLWVIKLSVTGDVQWQKGYGGSDYEFGDAIIQTTDGGYALTGYSYSVNGDVIGGNANGNLWVLKLSNTGTLEWQKSYGGSGEDIGADLKQTTDGGFIIVGLSPSSDGNLTVNHGQEDFWVLKLTTTGALEWQKSLGGSGDDWGLSIFQTADGGYLTGGFSSSNDWDVTGHHGTTESSDYWLAKLSISGSLQWEQSYGGSAGQSAFSLLPTLDGGAIMAGTSASNNGDVTGHHGDSTTRDFWIVKLGAAPTVTTLTFNGNGNWSNAANWSNNQVPTSPVPAGTQIVINPQAGGECILNVPVTRVC